VVVVSNDTAAAGPLKQKAFQRAETLAPQRDHEFERSKLLTATLPLVTRMFLLGLFHRMHHHRRSDLSRIGCSQRLLLRESQVAHADRQG
jgi:hypothetical protein